MTRWLHRIEDAVLALLLAVLVFGAGLQVFLRAFFDIGVPWLDPMLRALVLWLAMLGALAAARGDRHISIELVARFLGERGQRMLRAFGLFFGAAVCALLAWYAMELVRLESGFPQLAFARVPTWAVMLILPVGFGLLALRMAWRALQRAES